MGGVATPSEHRVRCLAPLTKSGGDEELRLEIDGKPMGVKLRIGRLSAQLVVGLPDRALDLLEIAALVYGADAAISRGGSADQQMGQKWHRRFRVDIPVRDQAFWSDAGVIDSLEQTLMFLSGDRFTFTFSTKSEPEAERSRYFKFDDSSAWQATRVLMFSGGLDSFAGALEEIAEHGQRVALVSHFSASKIAPVQRNLQKALSEKFGPESCRHIPVQVQMTGRGMKEGTHRSRSFLFAVLGAITAQAFGLDRVSFHENGVVSLNLPPVGNVLGTRATRTTHPQTLVRFSEFFDMFFDRGIRVDNPFFWRTKMDVVETIARLNMRDQIAHTRSCADVHNQTKQHVHCGRCSQCIDRRFAILAAGLARFDPGEAYKVDLLEDARDYVRDREIALSYMRNALAFEHMTETDIERTFPAVLDAVGYLDHPPETGLAMITQLFKRHGAAVGGVLGRVFDERPASDYPEGSLPRLFGDAQRAVVLPGIGAGATAGEEPKARPIRIEIDERRQVAELDGVVTFRKGTTSRLLVALARAWLEGAGKGLAPLDFPCIPAGRLADELGHASEEAVRQAVNRARIELRKRFTSAGRDGAKGAEIVENVHWHGYRLAPDRVVVRARKDT